MSKIRILSIDGGGIRGVLPGTILNYIERKLQEKKGAGVKLSEYFDMIAGTSTGGILTCLYLVPDETGKPKYSASKALDIYLKKGGEIFDVGFRKKIMSIGGLSDEKYSEKALEKQLAEYFKDTKLSELLKPCLVPAYDIEKREAKFFTSHDAESDLYDYFVKDVARSTSAAPTYFEPARVKSLFGAPFPLIDGGVFANNPALCAYAEARTINFEDLSHGKPNKPTAKDMMIVSIGTGSVEKSYKYDDMKNSGMIGWIQPIIDIMMSGNSETVHYQLKLIFDTLGEGDRDNYYRLEPQIRSANNEMDDASEKNLQALHEDGLSFVSENEAVLDEIIDKLIANE